MKVKIGTKVWLWSSGHATYLPGKVVAYPTKYIALVSWQYGVERVSSDRLLLAKPAGYS